MLKPFEDLTLSEALHDPLILAVAKADGISADELGRMLYAAANSLQGKGLSSAQGRSAPRFAGDFSAPVPAGLLRSQPVAAQCCGLA